MQTFVWNGIPRGTAVHYWVEAKPKSASGPHGTSSGKVAILEIRSVYIRDNYNSDTSRVEIDIKNVGSSATYFTIYQGVDDGGGWLARVSPQASRLARGSGRQWSVGGGVGVGDSRTNPWYSASVASMTGTGRGLAGLVAVLEVHGQQLSGLDVGVDEKQVVGVSTPKLSAPRAGISSTWGSCRRHWRPGRRGDVVAAPVDEGDGGG